MLIECCELHTKGNGIKELRASLVVGHGGCEMVETRGYPKRQVKILYLWSHLLMEPFQ